MDKSSWKRELKKILKEQHTHVDDQIAVLEKIREHDRSSESKSKITDLKKEKLLLKDKLKDLDHE